MKLMILQKSLIALFFVLIILPVVSQNYYSKRINVANKLNQSGSLLFINDTFYIPTTVYEIPYNKISTSLVKINKNGFVISALRFKPSDRNYFGGGGVYFYHDKIYTASTTDWGLQLQAGLYTFKLNGDTVFTKSYGDTTFYNYGNKILPYLKTKNKLLILGITDSTTGLNHPGLYKPYIRVVDTNGILYQTKLYTNTNVYRSLWGADTTTNKGVIFCGTEGANSSVKNYIIKLDSNLNQQWYKYIDTGGSLYNSVVALKKGKLLFAHNHTDSSLGNTYFWDRITLTKLDVSGNILWRKRYGNAEKDISVSKVKECANGDFILCGQKYINYTSTANQLVGWLMRTDSMGNLKWWYTYIPKDPIKDTVAGNYLLDVQQLPDGSFAAAGQANGSSQFGTVLQTWLLRVDSNGCFGSGNCPPNVAVGINEFADGGQNSLNLSVYPNPANESINLVLDVVNSTELKLMLVNALGEEVYTETTKSKNIKINTSDFAAGLYFITIKGAGNTFSKKIVIRHE